MNQIYDAIILGAGVSGCSLGILLAKHKDLNVLVIEKNSEKAHKVGESLLPDTTSRFAKILGIKDKIDNFGFPRKYGASVIWGKSKEPWHVIFDPKLDKYLYDKDSLSQEDIDYIWNNDFIYSYQVDRYYFDDIFVQRLLEVGGNLKRGEKVEEVLMSSDEKVQGVQTRNEDGEINEYRAKIVIDASGQKGIIGNKLGLREYNEELGFLAHYTYFKDFKFYDKFYSKFTQHIISIDTGWIWIIHIGSGVVSVGVVTDSKIQQSDLLSILKKHIGKYIDGAQQVDHLGNPTTKVHTASNWSYMSRKMYGENYVLLGDSAGFVDPVLSGGTSFAISSAFLSYKFILEFLKTGNIDCLKKYELLLSSDQKNYYEMAKFWYGNNKSRDGFFWKAKQLLGYEGDNTFNRNAFIYLTSGRHYGDKYLRLFEGEMNIGGQGFDHTERIEIDRLVSEDFLKYFNAGK